MAFDEKTAQELSNLRALYGAMQIHKESVAYAAFAVIGSLVTWSHSIASYQGYIALGLAILVHWFMRIQLLRRDHAALLIDAYGRTIQRILTPDAAAEAEVHPGREGMRSSVRPLNYIIPTVDQLNHQRGRYADLPVSDAHNELLRKREKSSYSTRLDESLISYGSLLLIVGSILLKLESSYGFSGLICSL